MNHEVAYSAVLPDSLKEFGNKKGLIQYSSDLPEGGISAGAVKINWTSSAFMEISSKNLSILPFASRSDIDNELSTKSKACRPKRKFTYKSMKHIL